jgi:ubiquinone/menaquinone biosynthesis C-methylase UbiE
MGKKGHDNCEHSRRFSAEGDFVERLEGPERRAAIPTGEIVPRMGLRSNDTIVDLGAGIGYFSIPIAERVKRVISVDLEPKMLEILSSRIRTSGIQGVEPIRAEITSLPIADGSVDAVLAAFVYHEVDDRKMLMAEASRVLRSGGAITVIDFQKRETAIGPPVSERKTPKDVLRSVPEGLSLVEKHETDVYYQLEFRKA